MKKKENTKILTREEVPVNETWDLSHIYPSDDAFFKAEDQLVNLMGDFTKEYKGKLIDKDMVIKALKAYEEVLELRSRTENYVSLHISSDRTNEVYQKNYANYFSKISGPASELSFFFNELVKLKDEVLESVISDEPSYELLIKHLLMSKEHRLADESEQLLASLGESFDLPYKIYETAKLADLSFPEFKVGGKKYPLSFANFEGEYEFEEDTKIRREAFRAFSENLKKYKYTIGEAYYGQIRGEKILSKARRYDSVFTMLLEGQKVDMELYNRQLDVIMEELAPHMRKYANLIKEVHKLDKMTYADLKLDLDPEFEPSISPEESKEYVVNALKVMGEDYEALVKRALEERWCDFAQNKGKSTGGFCSGVPKVHPYILLNWTNKMREVFVLAHELGHAVHDIFTESKQTILNSNLSMYAIEAPSTMNEMLMGNYLMSQAKDLRFKRWVIASIIARTYFHNFVTHFLEGYYQREVYRLIDKGQSLNSDDFSRIFKETLSKFWGEEVELTEGAELTWMRQPHYYMGLYPYTYSAGLTISTAVSKRILNEGEKAVNDWRNCLMAGGTVTPVEFAKMAGVDITTDKPLKETIAHIGGLIDDLVELTKELNMEKKPSKDKKTKEEKKVKKEKEEKKLTKEAKSKKKNK